MSKKSQTSSPLTLLINSADSSLLKDLTKLLARIERVYAPTSSLVYTNVANQLSPIQKKLRSSYYLQDANLFKSNELEEIIGLGEKHIEPLARMINWDLFVNEVVDALHLPEDIYTTKSNNDQNSSSNESSLPQRKEFFEILNNEAVEEIWTEQRVQQDKQDKIYKKIKIKQLHSKNKLPIMPGKWRKENYTFRQYKEIEWYEPTSIISKEEGEELLEELRTSLTGYVGQAYNYDDNELTEEWMKNFKTTNKSISEDEMIHTQIFSLLDIMTTQVQDQINNEEKTYLNKPLVLNEDIEERLVWGIDSYTRRMIELCIEEFYIKKLNVQELNQLDFKNSNSKKKVKDTKKEINLEDQLNESCCKSHENLVKNFIEKLLLPSINLVEGSNFDMSNCLIYLKKNLENFLVSSKSFYSSNFPSHKDLTHKLKNLYLNFIISVEEGILLYGIENFKIHPKGTGIICINPNGINSNQLVTTYLGEIYPSYRWCEKLEVIEKAQEEYGLKPTLPDFYNILLEKPKNDYIHGGYNLFYVDASQKANLASSCSHSCNSNCTTAIIGKDGQLSIVLTTNRPINYGEELTIDYYSITTSEIEWRASICLCGMLNCRGTFLHYMNQEDLQQILNQNSGPLYRYASLLRSCSDLPLSSSDLNVLKRHGIKKPSLKDKTKMLTNDIENKINETNTAELQEDEVQLNWLTKFSIDILKFVEYERKALPCKLLREIDTNSNSSSIYSQADLEARSVMEQRIQALVCCHSLICKFLEKQNKQENINKLPLIIHNTFRIREFLYNLLKTIPFLLHKFIILPLENKKDKVNLNTKNEKKTKIINDVSNVINNINSKYLKEMPQSMLKLNDCFNNIILQLKTIKKYSTTIARINQLIDVLILWKNTKNFSSPNLFDEVISDPVTVFSHDLGTNISRSKLFNKFQIEYESTRKRSRESAFNSSNSTQSDIDIEKSYKKKPEIKETVIESNTFLHNTVDNSNSNLNINSTSFTPVKNNDILSPNEPIYSGCRIYDPFFIFSQLMQWFNAGTDIKLKDPDLFGCVLLPLPSQCFGESESNYLDKQEEILTQILKDDKKQNFPWAQPLRSSFSNYYVYKIIQAKESEIHEKSEEKIDYNEINYIEEEIFSFYSPLQHLYGSPFLDCSLGQIDSIYKSLKDLDRYNSDGNKKKKDNTNNKISNDNSQLDNILPPELPTNWIQCSKYSCQKWRRVPWYVNVDTLPDNWTCEMNSWDVELASCIVPEDDYDPSKENTITQYEDANLNLNLKKKTKKPNSSKSSSTNISHFNLNDWKDILCLDNNIYYEAKIIKIVKNKGKTKLLFHYRGWSSDYDELIDHDSHRIKPHHYATSPDLVHTRDQERFQGVLSDDEIDEVEKSNELQTVQQSQLIQDLNIQTSEEQSILKEQEIPVVQEVPQKQKILNEQVIPVIQEILDIQEISVAEEDPVVIQENNNSNIDDFNKSNNNSSNSILTLSSPASETNSFNSFIKDNNGTIVGTLLPSTPLTSIDSTTPNSNIKSPLTSGFTSILSQSPSSCSPSNDGKSLKNNKITNYFNSPKSSNINQ